jgi:hypothetical protein
MRKFRISERSDKAWLLLGKRVGIPVTMIRIARSYRAGGYIGRSLQARHLFARSVLGRCHMVEQLVDPSFGRLDFGNARVDTKGLEV